jgi:hypothetical protein
MLLGLKLTLELAGVNNQLQTPRGRVEWGEHLDWMQLYVRPQLFLGQSLAELGHTSGSALVLIQGRCTHGMPSPCQTRPSSPLHLQ